jgi:UDP-2,4-diacetamido-2,4,6-trideoxy-beta-L-altropyranose hydrolase
MRVFILTEGGLHIGFGHVTRCLAIYDAFREKKIDPLLAVNGDETVAHLMNGTIGNICTNWVYEPEALLDYMRNADIAVVDSYLADQEFYRRISETVRTPVYFDDTMRINYPRGVVINGNICAEELNYPQRKDITYLLGSQYIPMRKEFWDVPEKKVRRSIKTVMITFGGNDIRNLTPWILKTLNREFPEYIKRVVIGDGFRNKACIEGLIDKKTELVMCPDAKEMKEVMLESDIAISAGGQTLYELARVGVPAIAIAVADNQLFNIRGLHKAGCIEDGGRWGDKNRSRRLIKGIETLDDRNMRIKSVQSAREFIDGLGARRIVKYSLRSYFKNSIILRKAESKDVYDVYELSNESEVRRNSFNQEKIELKNHREWFAHKLKEEDYLFLIAEVNNNCIGYVRFDVNRNEAFISVCINRNLRGFGAGETVIQKALEYSKSIKPQVKSVKAYIKEGNIASKRLFEKTHFEFLDQCTVKNHSASLYIYRFKEDTNELCNKQ